MSFEELIDHFKLDAEILPGHTIHRYHRPNRALGRRETIEVRWDRVARVGEGAFGQVWRESNREPNGPEQVRAVKIIDKQRMVKMQVDIKKELLALIKFSKDEHRQADVLVSFLGWFETERHVFLTMEYFEHGDLSQHISDVDTEDAVRQITIDLLEGLRIMHSEGFAHRDLKPQNIFVVAKPPRSARWWVKIGDFGISKRVRNGDTAWRTQTGTPYFQAPEIQGFVNGASETTEYNNAVDIWSLGCIVYNISAQQVPFMRGYDVNTYCQGHAQLAEGPLSPCLSQAGIEFVRSLLMAEPAQRPTVERALNDSWLLDVPPTNAHAPFSGSRPRSVLTQTLRTPDLSTNAEVSVHSDSYVTVVSRSNRASSGQQNFPPCLEEGRRSSSSNTSIALANANWERNSTSSNGFIMPLPVTHDDEISVYYDSLSLLDETTSGMSAAFQPSAAPFEQDAIPSMKWIKNKTIRRSSGNVSPVAFSPDGKQIVSGLRDTTVRLWDVATGQVLYTLIGHSGWVWSVAFSPDGGQIASGSGDMMVWLWDWATGQALRILSGHSDRVMSVAFSPDSKQIVSGSRDKTVRLWDVATGQALHTLSGHSDRVISVAFSPDGKRIASGSGDMTVRLWDTATGQASCVLSGHSDRVMSVVFSPNGKQVASGSRDMTVQLWDVVTGQKLCSLSGHSGWIVSVAFSPDSKQIVSGSQDKTVRLWAVATGQTVNILSGHSGWVTSVAFSPNGMQIVTGSLDSKIRFWEARPSRKEGTLKSSFRRLFS